MTSTPPSTPEPGGAVQCSPAMKRRLLFALLVSLLMWAIILWACGVLR